MKKIGLIISIFLVLNSQAQNLDTVRVRTLTMQAQDWAFLVGAYNGQDSVSQVALRVIRNKVQSNIPASWTTNVTIDSIPGVAVVEFYRILCTSPAAVIANRYTAIKTAISGRTQISTWINLIDTAVSTEFDRVKNIGKNKVVDQ